MTSNVYIIKEYTSLLNKMFQIKHCQQSYHQETSYFSSLMPSLHLLSEINSKTFTSLTEDLQGVLANNKILQENIIRLYLQKVVEKVDEFFNEELNRRLKKMYKKALQNDTNIYELHWIILYMLIKISHNSTIIAFILNASPIQQEMILQEFENIQNNYIEQNVEVKFIIEKITALQDINDKEKISYQNIEKQNNQIMAQISEINVQSKLISEQNIKYEDSKRQMFQQLSVYELKEFICLCEKVTLQNKAFSLKKIQKQEDFSDKMIENKKLKNQIVLKGKEIIVLSDTFDHLKQEYSEIKSQFEAIQYQQSCKVKKIHIPLLDLKSDFNKQHKMTCKLETDRTCDTQINLYENDKSEKSWHQIKGFNVGLEIKLKELEAQQIAMNQQIDMLRKEKQKQKRKFLLRKEKQVMLLEETQSFIELYGTFEGQYLNQL